MISVDFESITDKIITAEELVEVTTPRLFIRDGMPDPEGLASYEIFGLPGTEERKTKFGYIKLNDIFVHPHCMFELKALKRDFYSLVMGEADFYFAGGTIVKVLDATKVPKGVEVGTGVAFLYKHWKDLDFSYEGVKQGPRRDRLRFFSKMLRSEVFCNKLLVIPPFYRDVDMNSSSKKNEVNVYYTRVMNNASTIKANKEMLGALSETTDAHKSIIDAMSEYYERIIKMFGGRKGFIHKYIMGKATDFSSRLVITSSLSTKANTPAELMVDFGHASVPMNAVAKCFAPFVFHGIKRIVERTMSSQTMMWIKDPKTGKLTREELAIDWRKCISRDNIFNLFEIYDESKDHRFDIFKVKLASGKEVPLMYININEGDIIGGNDAVKMMSSLADKAVPMTLIHLFYMAIHESCIDKHFYITRYPIEDQNNTYPAKMIVNSYVNTGKVKINDVEYPNFPIIDMVNDPKDPEAMFVDSLQMCPIYNKALNADHDGDQLSLYSVYCQESNADADRQIYSKSNVLNIGGGTMRQFGASSQHAIYNLTYTSEVL